MSDINAQEFGRLQAEVSALRRDQDKQTELIERISEQLKDMQDTLSEAKGGWRVLMLVGGAGAAAGTVLTKLALWFSALPVPK